MNAIYLPFLAYAGLGLRPGSLAADQRWADGLQVNQLGRIASKTPIFSKMAYGSNKIVYEYGMIVFISFAMIHSVSFG